MPIVCTLSLQKHQVVSEEPSRLGLKLNTRVMNSLMHNIIS